MTEQRPSEELLNDKVKFGFTIRRDLLIAVGYMPVEYTGQDRYWSWSRHCCVRDFVQT